MSVEELEVLKAAEVVRVTKYKNGSKPRRSTIVLLQKSDSERKEKRNRSASKSKRRLADLCSEREEMWFGEGLKRRKRKRKTQTVE